MSRATAPAWSTVSTSSEEPNLSDGVRVPGARLLTHAAVTAARAEWAASAHASARSIDAATNRFAGDVATVVGGVHTEVRGAFSAAGERLSVVYRDVETMTAAIIALGRESTELAARTATVGADSELLASIPFSPATGVAVEMALGSAAARLAASAVRATAVSVVTGAVVSTFAAADACLAAGAGALGATGCAARSFAAGGAALTGALAGAAATVVVAQVRSDLRVAGAVAGTAGDLARASTLVPVLAGGGVVAAGHSFGAVTVRALRGAFAELSRSFGGDGRFNPFDSADLLRYGAAFAVGFDHHFSLDSALAGTVDGVQTVLGATGPFYDDILTGLVASGFAFGLFRDSDVTVRSVHDVSRSTLDQSAGVSASALDIERDAFHTVDGRIVPSDWGSMLAGLSQIDDVSGVDRAIIRVFSVRDSEDNIVEYRVQIPSTASWNPLTQSHGTPGDVTSDVYTMLGGSDASLTAAVYEAMHQAGIPSGAGAPPVELDGFSLGGITAAAVAADPRGYNIVEIHTAGSPIGGIPVDGATRVCALEAAEDLVTALDGRSNPDRQGWTTVSGPGVPTSSEKHAPAMLPGTVHAVRRYAVMGAEHDALRSVGALHVPAGGTIVVHDYEAVRER